MVQVGERIPGNGELLSVGPDSATVRSGEKNIRLRHILKIEINISTPAVHDYNSLMTSTSKKRLLTGDTPRQERQALAANPPTILLANPDILHYSLLPDHRRWRELLGSLSVIALDELHSYRGVFGAHVSLVLRRLRRLTRLYGAQPAFIAASATIANPVELTEYVVGRPFEEIRGDAAGSGARRFIFWRPPLRVSWGDGPEPWTLTVFGFVEADYIFDSTRSYDDAIGSGLRARYESGSSR